MCKNKPNSKQIHICLRILEILNKYVKKKKKIMSCLLILEFLQFETYINSTKVNKSVLKARMKQ